MTADSSLQLPSIDSNTTIYIEVHQVGIQTGNRVKYTKMTKDWDLVKEDIVNLIRSGASLERVRKELSTDRQFQASTRSYRKKLKEWKLTRVAQFEAQSSVRSSSEVGTPTVPEIQIHTTFPDQDGSRLWRAPEAFIPMSPTATSTSLQASLALDGEAMYREAERMSPRAVIRDHRQLDSSISALTPTEGNSARTSIDDSQETAYRRLASAQSGPQVNSTLDEIYGHSAEDLSIILHRTIDMGNMWVSDCIVDYMLNTNSTLGSRQSLIHTALLYAIRINRVDVVRLLLRRGASVTGVDGTSWQPLHEAAARSVSAGVCRVLLRQGADVNAHQFSDQGHPPTPLYIAAERALKLPHGQEKDDVSAMIEVMLANGAKSSVKTDDDRPAVIQFLYEWTQWDAGSSTSYEYKFLIGHYIRADCNPLCWFPRSYCKDCNMLASYVFAHTNSELGERLIESSDLKRYGLEFAALIVKPCEESNALREDTWLSDLLGCLLRRSISLEASWKDELVHQILERSPELEKVPLLTTLLKYNGICVIDRRRALTRLAQIPGENVRWQLAEVLLWPGRGLTDRKMYNDFIADYVSSLSAYSGVEKLAKEINPGFRDHYLDALGLRTTGLGAEEGERVMQCLVHVATRAILDEWAFGIIVDERERLLAVQLRKIYNLPALMISSNYLVERGPLNSSFERSSSATNHTGDWRDSARFGRRHSAEPYANTRMWNE